MLVVLVLVVLLKGIVPRWHIVSICGGVYLGGDGLDLG